MTNKRKLYKFFTFLHKPMQAESKRRIISSVDIWVCCSSSSGLLSFDRNTGNLVKTPVAYFTGMRWECTGKMHFSEEPCFSNPCPSENWIDKQTCIVYITSIEWSKPYIMGTNTKPTFIYLFCDSSGTCSLFQWRVYVNMQFYLKLYCEPMSWLFFSFSCQLSLSFEKVKQKRVQFWVGIYLLIHQLNMHGIKYNDFNQNNRKNK